MQAERSECSGTQPKTNVGATGIARVVGTCQAGVDTDTDTWSALSVVTATGTLEEESSVRCSTTSAQIFFEPHRRPRSERRTVTVPSTDDFTKQRPDPLRGYPVTLLCVNHSVANALSHY